VARDHRKLKVFELADDMVLAVYERTRALPAEERYGLQAQIRRASVSVASRVAWGLRARRISRVATTSSYAGCRSSSTRSFVRLRAEA
jgi:four helix bundle protein